MSHRFRAEHEMHAKKLRFGGAAGCFANQTPGWLVNCQDTFTAVSGRSRLRNAQPDLENRNRDEANDNAKPKLVRNDKLQLEIRPFHHPHPPLHQGHPEQQTATPGSYQRVHRFFEGPAVMFRTHWGRPADQRTGGYHSSRHHHPNHGPNRSEGGGMEMVKWTNLHL